MVFPGAPHLAWPLVPQHLTRPAVNGRRALADPCNRPRHIAQTHGGDTRDGQAGTDARWMDETTHLRTIRFRMATASGTMLRWAR